MERKELRMPSRNTARPDETASPGPTDYRLVHSPARLVPQQRTIFVESIPLVAFRVSTTSCASSTIFR